MASLEGAARPLEGPERSTGDLVRSLLVRYSVERAVADVAVAAAVLLGGHDFFGGTEVSMLVSASQGLAFHPPSRRAMGPALMHWLHDGKLEFPS